MNFFLKFLYIFSLIFSVSGVSYAQKAEKIKDMGVYISGRLIVDALKVVGDTENVKGFDATTTQFGPGIGVGLYKRFFGFLTGRIEIDYSYTMRSNSFYHAAMVNVYAEGNVPSAPVSPYVMAGGGINVFDPPFSDIESGPAFNAGIGVIIDIIDNWRLDLGFRYMQGSINFHNNEGYSKVKNYNGYLGFMYSFP